MPNVRHRARPAASRCGRELRRSPSLDIGEGGAVVCTDGEGVRRDRGRARRPDARRHRERRISSEPGASSGSTPSAASIHRALARVHLQSQPHCTGRSRAPKYSSCTCCATISSVSPSSSAGKRATTSTSSTGASWRPGPAGAPVIEGCDWIAGRIGDRFDLGDHVGYLLHVIDAGHEHPDAPQLGLQRAETIDPGHSADSCDPGQSGLTTTRLASCSIVAACPEARP